MGERKAYCRIRTRWLDRNTLSGVGRRLLPLPLARLPKGSRGVVDAVAPVRGNVRRMSGALIVTVGRLCARPSNCRQPISLMFSGPDGVPMCSMLVLVLNTARRKPVPRELPPSGAL